MAISALTGQSTDDDVRHALVARLQQHACLLEWEVQGYRVLQLGDYQAAIRLVGQYRHVEQMTLVDLTNKYLEMGYPEEKGMEKIDIAKFYMNALFLQELPLMELRKECKRRNLPIGEVSQSGDEEQRYQLIDRLSTQERMDWWESKGYEAYRIGTLDAVIQVVSQYEQIDQMSMMDLMKWYKAGFPEEKDMEQSDLVKLRRRVVFLGALPLAELQKECVHQLMPIDEVSQFGDDDEQRHQLMDRLLKHERMDTWEAKGYQAHRICNFDDMIQVISHYEHFLNMSDEELCKRCRDSGVPAEKNTERDELLKRLKVVLLWEFLPLVELEKDCTERNLQIQPASTTSNDDEKRLELLHLLMVDLRVSICRDLYEQKGIPVGRLGSWHAHCIGGQVDNFEAMTNEDLKTMCTDVGISTESVMERCQLIGTLKAVLIWELLPLAELQKDCLERNLPIQPGRAISNYDEKHAELLHRLKVDMKVKLCRRLYEDRGVPVGRLGSLCADRVFVQFGDFEAMSIQQLRDTNEEFGMPLVPSLSKKELLGRLQDISLWEALPIAELLTECQVHRIPVSGVSLGDSDEEEREQLIDLLLFSRCARTFEAMEVPAKELNSFRAATNVARERANIDAMSDAAVIRKYSDMGLSTQYLEKQEIRERLKKVSLWKEMSFKDLQLECRAHQVNCFFAQEDERADLVLRFAAAHWPPKPNPKPPSPPMPSPPHSKMASYFQVLQLPPSAGFDDVKKAYRRLALKYHPDKNQGAVQDHAAKEFRKVAEAYETLSEHFKVKGR